MTQKKKAFKNIVRKRENAGNQHFLFSPQNFLPIAKRTSVVKMHFILSSANALSLDQSKNLSFGKQLNIMYLLNTISKVWWEPKRNNGPVLQYMFR